MNLLLLLICFGRSIVNVELYTFQSYLLVLINPGTTHQLHFKNTWLCCNIFLWKLFCRECLLLRIKKTFGIVHNFPTTFIIPGQLSFSKRSVANPDHYFRYTASFICLNFAYNCNSCIAFHLSIILVTYQIYWNGSFIRQDKKNLFNLKNIMTKIIYLSWNPHFKLLYMSWNFYREILNILLQNLMRMEHFEICVLKLIKLCLFQCQPTALLRASGSTQGGLDGVKCGLFSHHSPLGQTTLRVGWVSV